MLALFVVPRSREMFIGVELPTFTRLIFNDVLECMAGDPLYFADGILRGR